MNTEIIDLINRNHGDSLDDCAENILMYKNAELVCSINVYRFVVKEMSNHAGHARFFEYSHGIKTKLSNEGSQSASKILYKKEKTQVISSKDIEWGNDASYALVNKLSGKVYQASEAPQTHDSMRGVIVFDGLLCVTKAFNVIERKTEKTELDIAKEKQVKKMSFIYSHWFDDKSKVTEMFQFMQDNDELAEIVLPLESDDDEV